MLAQNFKTYAELGIEQDVFDALITVMRMAERGELIHVVKPNETPYTPGKLFNMDFWHAYRDCGTVACIGGYVEELLGRDEYDDSEPTLWELYHPYALGDQANWATITPAQAAIAIRNYLTTGRANWLEAVKC